MSLPYPGRYESHGSWMRRCDEYGANRRSWQRSQASRCNNWGGYNYHKIELNDIRELPNGAKIKFVKYGSGNSHGPALRRFATKNNLIYSEIIWPGTGWTGRTDHVAYRAVEQSDARLTPQTLPVQLLTPLL